MKIKRQAKKNGVPAGHPVCLFLSAQNYNSLLKIANNARFVWRLTSRFLSKNTEQHAKLFRFWYKKITR